MGRSWDRETKLQTQSQAEQDYEAKETRKKYPMKVTQTTTRAQLSEPTHVCLSTRTLFLLINTLLISLLSISLWQFISTKPKGQGLVTGHWPWRSSGQDCCYLPSISGPKRKSCFKPLQVKATRDQTQRNTLTTYFIILNIFYLILNFSLKYLIPVNFFPVPWVSSTDTAFSMWWYYYTLHALWRQNSLRANRIREFFPNISTQNLSFYVDDLKIHTCFTYHSDRLVK